MENEIVRWVLSYIAFRIHKFVNLQYPCTIIGKLFYHRYIWWITHWKYL